MENFNKGGRPRKSSSQKKKYKVGFKIATADYYSLKMKARKANMTISEYVRECVAHSSVRERLTTEVQSYVRQLCGMANNLNQIARKANVQGYVSVRSEYIHLAEKMDQLLKKL